MENKKEVYRPLSQMDKNYYKLCEFLHDFKPITNIQFRAVLLALNLLSQTNFTKKTAYKICKRKYPTVSTLLINGIIKDMRIISNASLNNAKTFKVRLDHNILDNIYREKVSMDQTKFI